MPARSEASSLDPFALISQDSLFAVLADLTSIQPYSGWRNSATEGEAAALDYVAEALADMAYLRGLGLTLERQSFRVFSSTELWDTRLYLTLSGEEMEVQADGLRGPRDDIARARDFDSDGALNDAAPDPVIVQGQVVLVRSAQGIAALTPHEARGKVVFVDYAAIDRTVQDRRDALGAARDLVDKGPAALVLVTQFSNEPGESHGAFVADVSVLNEVEPGLLPPTLSARLEDMQSAGVSDWDDLAQVQAARLIWDADVLAPGKSGNLVAQIPGSDRSRAVILGAHIDSPNVPGAMDDGSGSAVLLEIARVLDASATQPPVDLYLAWFGSEELGLYGSYHFVSTHQELLDRTLAMLQIDCLTRPLEGIDAHLNLVTWSYGRLGNERLTWPGYLAQAVKPQGLSAFPANYYGVESDNTAFAGFDVPNANLIYLNHAQMEALGGVHYAGHLHDPYDTVELAREVGDVLEQMAQIALTAALATGQDLPALRVSPSPDLRAVFVASHTEAVHMSPATLTDLGMALAWEGYDVDLVPYGQAVTAGELAGASLVVVLPVVDYPSLEGDLGAYDAALEQSSVSALEEYVAQGGLLVLSNSAHRLKYHNTVLDANEDWDDMNELAGRFGVSYGERAMGSDRAVVEGGHPLTDGVTQVSMIRGNALPLRLEEGQVLARVGGEVAVAVVPYGNSGGRVVALADVGMLGASEGPENLVFWQNLARYARSR
jgi:hypothetical protein